ncbi:MAG: hypothetical protein LBL99_01880 [Holosporaceae bacterium]|nr:hypothetical protein [Holosporaceae bacterium]
MRKAIFAAAVAFVFDVSMAMAPDEFEGEKIRGVEALAAGDDEDLSYLDPPAEWQEYEFLDKAFPVEDIKTAGTDPDLTAVVEEEARRVAELTAGEQAEEQ